jgi:putative hydrolase
MRFDEDFHVHSTFSDDASSTLEENLAMAERAGLRTICMVDHVRADTPWVTHLVEQVRALRRVEGLRVLVGVESKILNRIGELDIPAGIAGVDHVLIADHQYPSESGPITPMAARALIAERELSVEDAVACIIDATVAAMQRAEHPIVAHPFSLLPKLGIAENRVSDAQIQHLANGAKRSQAMVEINEKWNCPGTRLAAALDAAGVCLVAGSDSHHCSSVGVYDRIRSTTSRGGIAVRGPLAVIGR